MTQLALLVSAAGIASLVLLFEGAPFAFQSLGGDRVSDRAARLERSLFAANADLPNGLHDEIKSIAFSAPLTALPFYAAAFEFDEARDAMKIIALLDQALQRDPRHYYARTWRARMYFLTQRPELAANELATLLAIDPARSAFYIDALIDLARDKGGRDALLRHLAQSPRWADGFARQAVALIEDPDFLAAMAESSKAAFDIYITKLADEGDLERAFLIWQSRLTKDELLQFSWPFDKRFDHATEAGVFGWSIAPALAQRSRSGLEVFYSGIAEPQIASQTLLLGPGYKYRLQLTATTELQDGGGQFALVVACRQSGTRLGEIILATSEPEPKLSSKDITVPAEDCSQQTLRLVGRRGEKTLRARATIHQVAIEEIGPAEIANQAAVPPSSTPSTP